MWRRRNWNNLTGRITTEVHRNTMKNVLPSKFGPAAARVCQAALLKLVMVRIYTPDQQQPSNYTCATMKHLGGHLSSPPPLRRAPHPTPPQGCIFLLKMIKKSHQNREEQIYLIVKLERVQIYFVEQNQLQYQIQWDKSLTMYKYILLSKTSSNVTDINDTLLRLNNFVDEKDKTISSHKLRIQEMEKEI